MVHFEDGIFERQVLDSVFQFLIIGGAEAVETFVVDAHGQHKVLELALRDACAPGQLLFGQESVVDALAVIVFRVVHAVAERHVGVEEFQGRLFIE